MKLMLSLGKRKERLPLIIIDIYIFVALFLYNFGPIKFKSKYTLRMMLYMLAFLVIINIAYTHGIWKSKHRMQSTSDEINATSKPLPFWFQMIGFLLPVLMIFSSIVLTGFSGLTTSLGETMAASYTFVQSGGTYQQGIDIPMWLYMHLAIFVYLSIVDGIIYFKRLNLLRKIIWGGTLLFLILYFVLFKGTQKTLGDVFILIISAILISTYLKRNEKPKIKKRFIVIIIIIAIIFMNILASILSERISYLGRLGYEGFQLYNSYWEVNLDSFLLKFFPKASRLGYACLVFYLCNGLCGLSYCLATPMTWSYGIGSIVDLSDIISRRFGIDVYQSTYVYKAYKEFGWHHSQYWHTIFPWIASDWTFIGALLIMGIAAYVYSICWQEILQGKNKESIFLFCLMNIIWIYLPANNQIFSTRTTGLIFVICIYMWLRRNRDVKKKKFFYGKK